MVSIDPLVRPNISDIMINPIFLNECKNSRCYSEPTPSLDSQSNYTEILLKFGSGNWKFKYVRICKDNLFIYKKRGDAKAKFCYQFDESKLFLENFTKSTEPFLVKTSCKEELKEFSAKLKRQHTWTSELAAERKTFVLRIEHRDLETLYLKLENEDQMKLVEVMKFNNSICDLTNNR